MRKKKGKKVLLSVFAGLLLVVAVLIGYYHDCAYAVFKNLTVKTIPMEESSDWEGGASYLQVPYAAESASQYVDLYVPSDVENPPLMVIVHGGGFISNDSQSRQAQKMYRYFRDHGYACASVNYRLAQEAGFPAALLDVKACIRFLKANADTYGYSVDQVSIFGESAGGYLACAAATSGDAYCELPFIGEESLTEKVDASVDVLIDFYGACYFREADAMWEEMNYPHIVFAIANSWVDKKQMEGFPDCHSYFIRKDVAAMSAEEYHEISMDGMMEKGLDDSLCVYISHGDCDITVPIGVSELFYKNLTEKLSEEQVILHVIPGAGHAADIMYTDEELETIDAFLRKNRN